MAELFDIPYIIGTYGYLGIFLVIFLETGIIFPLPGDSLLFTAGLLVAVLDLNLFILIPVIFVASFLGGLLGYEIGVNIEKLRRYSFFRKYLKEEHIIRAHVFFDKYGKVAIIVSRFIPMVRTFISIVAGVARMHYNQFVKYTLISSAIWSVTVTLAGFFLGRIFPQIKDYISIIIIIVVVGSVLPLIFEYFRKKED